MPKKWNYVFLVGAAALMLALAIWGPEQLARHQDKGLLNQISSEAVEESGGYRYALSSNEKLFVLAQCLNNQVLPESEQSALTKVEFTEAEYRDLTGSYAFVVNHQGPSGKEITEEEIFQVCNEQLEALKELGLLPETVREVTDAGYSAVLYSAIDVLEPRNSLSVWKVSLSTSQINADKTNRILDLYLDGETGKIYEFYVRIPETWEDLSPDSMMESWSQYLGLSGMEKWEDANPFLENTPYYETYRFPGDEERSTVVTLGFYEGINELFLKISR